MILNLPYSSDRVFKDSPKNTIINTIRPNLKDGPWVAGGAALSLFTGDPINDIDIYCRTEEQLRALEQKLYQNGNMIYESDNATSWKIYENSETFTIQLIKKGLYKNISEVFDTFDFTVCKIATDLDGNFVSTPKAVSDIGQRRLRVSKFSKDGFLPRWAKYTQYGYDMPVSEFNEYVSKVDNDDFKNIYAMHANY